MRKALNKLFVFLMAGFGLVWGCNKEQTIPVKVDFNYTVKDSDYSVPVKVQIENTSVDATWYHWSFEGGEPSSSEKKNPGTINYKQAGTYQITLTAGNDFEENQKTEELIVDDSIAVSFEYTIIENVYAPVTIQLKNNSSGASEYSWNFPGGTPATSTAENPEQVTFYNPGKYPVILTISNGREQHTFADTITVLDSMKTQFRDSVAFIDQDYQVPVTVYFFNESTNALHAEWQFEGGVPLSSSEENPVVTFTEPGTYTVTLTTTNNKTTETVRKQFEFREDRNLLISENIKFSIFQGRNTGSCFYATQTDEMFTEEEASGITDNQIDIAFFGMDSSFTFNQFVSPANGGSYGFKKIADALTTLFINSQERCLENPVFTTTDFDKLSNGEILEAIDFSQFGEKCGLQFSNETVPRIILFETEDGRKGAIKVKEFVSDGTDSYIVTDIKTQKTNRH